MRSFILAGAFALLAVAEKTVWVTVSEDNMKFFSPHLLIRDSR